MKRKNANLSFLSENQKENIKRCWMLIFRIFFLCQKCIISFMKKINYLVYALFGLCLALTNVSASEKPIRTIYASLDTTNIWGETMEDTSFVTKLDKAALSGPVPLRGSWKYWDIGYGDENSEVVLLAGEKEIARLQFKGYYKTYIIKHLGDDGKCYIIKAALYMPYTPNACGQVKIDILEVGDQRLVRRKAGDMIMRMIDSNGGYIPPITTLNF